VRYVYGITAALLIGGSAATLTLHPVGAQTAQNDPAQIQAAAPHGGPMKFAKPATPRGCSPRW
jgi:serine protease Do